MLLLTIIPCIFAQFNALVDVELLRVGHVSIPFKFKYGDRTINDTFEELRDGKITPFDLIKRSPIHVTEIDGLYWFLGEIDGSVHFWHYGFTTRSRLKSPF